MTTDRTRQNGAACRRRRKELGYNLPTLALKADVAANTLSNIESESQNASEPALRRIARALEVEYESLLHRSEDTEDAEAVA